MAYTLLQLVDQVSGELGLSQPAAVIGSTNNQTVQLLALSQRLGKDLVREFEWQRLVKAYVLQTTAGISTIGTITAGSKVITSMGTTTGLEAGNVVTGTGQAPYAEILSVDSATQVTLNTPVATSTAAVSMTFAKQDYAMPTDFDRMISDTNWDRTNHWRNLGTKTSQEWQWLQGGIISVGPRERYRIYNNRLRIFQALTSIYTFAFEYVSNYWVMSSGATQGDKGAYSVDTDTAIFPDDLMLAGLKFYFLKAKKLDYSVELGEFMRALSYTKAQDVPVPAQSLAPIGMNPLVGPWSVQDGNWPAQ